MPFDAFDVLRLPPSFEACWRGFNSQKLELISEMETELGYSRGDCNLLWDDLAHFFEGFETLVAGINEERKARNERLAKLCSGTTQVWLPWGRVLLVPASNAPIPIIPTLVLSTLIAGNNAEIVIGRRVKSVGARIVALLAELIPEWRGRVAVFDGGVRDAMAELVQKRSVKLAWIQGSSDHRIDLLHACMSSGVDVIYEGSGNPVAVLDNALSEQATAKAVNLLVKSLTSCKGDLCTATSLLFVPSHSAQAVGVLFQTAMRGVSPALFEASQMTSEEIGAAGRARTVTVVGYRRLEEVTAILEEYCFGIQVAVFTDRAPEDLLKHFHRVVVSRLLFNILPTFQRSLVPWGGYGASGPSNVTNLIEKVSRPVIVHTAV